MAGKASASSLDPVSSPGHLNVAVVTLALRWRWEAKGLGPLLGVELVLQLHEFA